MVGWDDVRKMALSLAGAEEGTSYGAPAFKAGGRTFACQPTHKSAESGSLAVRIPLERRADLLAEDPATYYVTEHYLDYPTVLVRLSLVRADALRDLLGGALRMVQAEGAGRAQRAQRKP